MRGYNFLHEIKNQVGQEEEQREESGLMWQRG